jgi:hypothetical protein
VAGIHLEGGRVSTSHFDTQSYLRAGGVSKLVDSVAGAVFGMGFTPRDSSEDGTCHYFFEAEGADKDSEFVFRVNYYTFFDSYYREGLIHKAAFHYTRAHSISSNSGCQQKKRPPHPGEDEEGRVLTFYDSGSL